jgi:hypothetical protein
VFKITAEEKHYVVTRRKVALALKLDIRLKKALYNWLNGDVADSNRERKFLYDAIHEEFGKKFDVKGTFYRCIKMEELDYENFLESGWLGFLYPNSKNVYSFFTDMKYLNLFVKRYRIEDYYIIKWKGSGISLRKIIPYLDKGSFTSVVYSENEVLAEAKLSLKNVTTFFYRGMDYPNTKKGLKDLKIEFQ